MLVSAMRDQGLLIVWEPSRAHQVESPLSQFLGVVEISSTLETSTPYPYNSKIRMCYRQLRKEIGEGD